MICGTAMKRGLSLSQSEASVAANWPIRGRCWCQLTNQRPGVLWHDGAIKPSLQAGNLKARALPTPTQMENRVGSVGGSDGQRVSPRATNKTIKHQKHFHRNFIKIYVHDDLILWTGASGDETPDSRDPSPVVTLSRVITRSSTNTGQSIKGTEVTRQHRAALQMLSQTPEILNWNDLLRFSTLSPVYTKAEDPV